MKKIIFIEPYASMGGHMQQHVSLIPKCCRNNKIQYKFFAEEGMKNCIGVKKYLRNISDLNQLNKKEKINIRKE